jgi:hypothetical protein
LGESNPEAQFSGIVYCVLFDLFGLRASQRGIHSVFLVLELIGFGEEDEESLVSLPAGNRHSSAD